MPHGLTHTTPRPCTLLPRLLAGMQLPLPLVPGSPLNGGGSRACRKRRMLAKTRLNGIHCSGALPAGLAAPRAPMPLRGPLQCCSPDRRRNRHSRLAHTSLRPRQSACPCESSWGGLGSSARETRRWEVWLASGRFLLLDAAADPPGLFPTRDVGPKMRRPGLNPGRPSGR